MKKGYKKAMIGNKSIYYCTNVNDPSHQCEYQNMDDNSCTHPQIKSCPYQKLKLNANLISWIVVLVEEARMAEIKSRITMRINKFNPISEHVKMIHTDLLSLYKIRYYPRETKTMWVVSVVITFEYSPDGKTHKYVLTPIHVTKRGEFIYDASKGLSTTDDVDKEYLVYDKYFGIPPELKPISINNKGEL